MEKDYEVEPFDWEDDYAMEKCEWEESKSTAQELRKAEQKIYEIIKKSLENSKKQVKLDLSFYECFHTKNQAMQYFDSKIEDCKCKIEQNLGLKIFKAEFVGNLFVLSFSDPALGCEEEFDLGYKKILLDLYLVKFPLEGNHTNHTLWQAHNLLMTDEQFLLLKLYYWIELKKYYANIFKYNETFLIKEKKDLCELSFKETTDYVELHFYLSINSKDETNFICNIPSIVKLLYQKELLFLKNLNVEVNNKFFFLRDLQKSNEMESYFDKEMEKDLKRHQEKVKRIERIYNKEEN